MYVRYATKRKVSNISRLQRNKIFHRDVPIRLIELEIIVHIGRVLAASLAVHLTRVIALDPSLLVAAKRVAGQIRVLLVQVVFGLVGLFRARGLEVLVSLIPGL